MGPIGRMGEMGLERNEAAIRAGSLRTTALKPPAPAA